MFNRASIAMLLMLTTFSSSANLPSQILQWSNDHVYKLQTSAGVGSGFFISNTTLVTACHVVEGQERARVFNHANFYIMTVDKCDTDLDIAILSREVDKESTWEATINTKPPEQGLSVYGAGYPLGYPLYISQGHVQNNYLDKGVFFLSANTISGDSGSPVLSIDEKGKIQIEGVRIAVMGKSGKELYPHLALAQSGVSINKVLAN